MFLELLIEKQRSLKESDLEFATRLGVSRQLWNFTRRSQQPIGWLVINGALKNFPELKDEAANFLLVNANKLPDEGTIVAETN